MNSRDVLSDQADLSDVRWALLGASPRRALRLALQDLLADGALVRGCRLRRAKFKPGRKLTVHFDVRVRANGADVVRPVVEVWDRGDGGAHREPHAVAEAEGVSRGLAAPFRRLLARLPESNVSLVVSPLDPRFPELVRLCDPRHVSAMLAGVVPGASREDYRVSSVRYRPGERHVLRYQPVSGPAGHAVFAKLSKRDPDVTRAFQLATRVADRLEATGGATRAVRPLAWIAEDRVILFPEVSGRPLSELLRFGNRAAIGYLEEAGRALAALHSAPDTIGEALKPRAFASDLEAVRRASEHVSALSPRFATLIAGTLERARATYDRLRSERATFTHGDFKADHLWGARGGLSLFDFGSCALGDPALDVGKFLADLVWWSPGSGSRSARATGVPGRLRDRRRSGEAPARERV